MLELICEHLNVELPAAEETETVVLETETTVETPVSTENETTQAA